jgi:fused signal recognition particle receptor
MLMVGINGSGKTTFLGKLAHKLVQKDKKVLLVAGDTFRAAATQQLAAWHELTGADLHVGTDKQDPASVIFDACVKFNEGGYDHLLIDTAGRLQTRVNLMNELSKMRRIIDQKILDAQVHTWLTIDSMLGQNSLQQARQFHEATTLTGLVLTKYDGTGKGGILFAISNEFDLPVQYLTFGEQLEQLRAFEKETFVDELLGE